LAHGGAPWYVRALPAAGGRISGKFLFAIAAAVAAVTVALALPRAEAATATGCPTFQVLHNDRIGPALLPAGTYTVKVTKRLSCQKAGSLFTRFLEDYDGVLPHRWRVRARGSGKASFSRLGRLGFTVTRSGGGAGATQSPLGHLCPGTFHVLHDDHIGKLAFPAGFYNIYSPRGSNFKCQRASHRFARFLASPSGVLPNGWRLKAQTAVFYRAHNRTRARFRVDPST
jgi:hypothetical protein